MKKFLAKAQKSFVLPKPAPTSPLSPLPNHVLQPKFLVPPVPHPSPHTHLAILVTESALLIRPHILGTTSASHVRIPWGKNVKVEEVSGQGSPDWDESVIVYGIVGVVELFSASQLLVITGKTDVGYLLEHTHSVYGLKGITAIPLEFDRARIVVNTLAARSVLNTRPSLLSSTTMDTINPGKEQSEDSEEPHVQFATLPRPTKPTVQFSPDDEVKTLSPTPQHSFPARAPSPSPSDVSGFSTPSESTSPVAPIAKALADRLSFWNRLSKRPLFPSSPDINEPNRQSQTEETILQKNEEIEVAVREERGDPAEVLGDILDATAPPPQTAQEQNIELENKVVREIVREFVKGGMYFAYNFDITRSLQHKQDQVAKNNKQNALLADLLPTARSSSEFDEGEQVNALSEPYPTLPLWRRVDRQYWWNEWMSKPFIDAGLHAYVLPIMQGFYQIGKFQLAEGSEAEKDETSVDYVVISRRSRDRAGLRYQRRGIDDEANVANFVETETIMRVKREGTANIFSYVQIRGSIPLFWTQISYALKPVPSLSTDRTQAQHLDAMKRHFEKTVPLYGPHTIVNLAEQHGKEGAVTTGYRERCAELNNKSVVYCEYDFHSETKGMKYENISKLITTMQRNFEQQGFFWISSNTIMSRQKGVFRVNCIDCLDRTNVVQSAFARFALNEQLSALALHNPAVQGRSEIDVVFNDMWANNGDAISRAYAGTSALKGDFTRTGRRDLTGMLNDGVNSLARMYSSTFSDWFCQAVIDFMLGHRTVSVFSEFLLKMQSSDPRDMIRLSKIRAEAIATSVERVLSEGERLLGGWTLFAPEGLNLKIADKFEEKVLLLTGQALYIISYDYNLEKVKLYTRVPLGDVTGIKKGAYILSPLEPASRDPVQNAGFTISWLPNNQVTRLTSYSVRNTPSALPDSTQPSPPPAKRPQSMATPAALFADLKKNRLSATLSKLPNATLLSNILTNISAPLSGSTESFAAFKMLPIDPARVRRASSMGGDTLSGHIDTRGELSEAATCQEAVDMIVDVIQNAVTDVGAGHNEFVTTGDIVSLAEAQQMTGMYAKIEYGVKRLLWLGAN